VSYAAVCCCLLDVLAGPCWNCGDRDGQSDAVALAATCLLAGDAFSICVCSVMAYDPVQLLRDGLATCHHRGLAPTIAYLSALGVAKSAKALRVVVPLLAGIGLVSVGPFTVFLVHCTGGDCL
jgi:hypothetical protein